MHYSQKLKKNHKLSKKSFKNEQKNARWRKKLKSWIFVDESEWRWASTRFFQVGQAIDSKTERLLRPETFSRACSYP